MDAKPETQPEAPKAEAAPAEGAAAAIMAGNKGEMLQKIIVAATPILQKAVQGFTVALPHIIAISKRGYKAYKMLHPALLSVAIGMVFCFFGGVYPTIFAAVQAMQLTGWGTTKKALMDLGGEAQTILAESAKDDEVDADGDGVADTKQITPKELLMRKTQLVLTKCDPQKINTAIGGLYMSWIGVMATLKIQFARTITMALTLAEMFQKPCDYFLKPGLNLVVPEAYKKWIPVCLGWLCKSIAMSIAWYIQRMQSAYASAMIGGLMVSRSLMSYMMEKGINPGGLLPKDDKDTYIDEVTGWSLAALGFYVQFKLNFAAPFPLNWLLFPFEWLEYYIQWSITSA
jgi:hypothetical protein